MPGITIANGDSEGLGLVLLEAQAAGVPVVTSARAAIQEAMIDGVTGFAFGEKDVESLASKLIFLLSDDKAATSMAAAGRRFVSGKFDIVRCTERLEQLYDRIVDGSH